MTATGQLFAYSADDGTRKHISRTLGRFKQKPEEIKVSWLKSYCTAVQQLPHKPN